MTSLQLSNPIIENAQLIEGDRLKASISLEAGEANGIYYSLYGYENGDWKEISNSDLSEPDDAQGFIAFNNDVAILRTRFAADEQYEGIEKFQARFFEDSLRSENLYDANFNFVVIDKGSSAVNFSPEWTKTVTNDSGHYIAGISTSEDGSIAVGTTSSYANNNNIKSFKYSNTGDLLFESEKLSNHHNNFRADGDISMTPDGGVVHVGFNYGNAFNPLFVKVDSEGAYQWNTEIDDGSKYGLISSSTVDDNGNIIGVGRETSSSGNQVVYKLDSNGNEIWSKNLSSSDLGANGSNTTTSTSILTDSSGNIYISSDAQNPGGSHLTSLSSDGNVRWTQDIGARGFDTHITIDNSDNIYAIGGSGDLRKFSPNGDVEWSLNLATEDSGEWAGIAVNSSGLFVAKNNTLPGIEYEQGWDFWMGDEQSSVYKPTIYSLSGEGEVLNVSFLDLDDENLNAESGFKFASAGDDSLGIAYRLRDENSNYELRLQKLGVDFDSQINLDSDITLKQRHTDKTGGNFLKLAYALKGDDETGNPGGDANRLGVDNDGLSNAAVLGPNTQANNLYTLEISAESLKEGWNLESADISLKYNSDIFKDITVDDITIAGELPVNNSISIDDANGLIRFAAGSLGNLQKGSSIFDENIFASIKLDFDESYFQDSARNPDANGKFTFDDGNPLSFELSANSDETVFSRTFDSDVDGKEIAGGAFTNREIKSLGDLKGDTTFDKNDVNLYQAEIKFEEQDGGLTFGTKRVIGANQGFTNLIRKGDIVTAETTIQNVGNSLAKDILIEDAALVENASFVTSRFLEKISGEDELAINNGEKVDLSGGVFRDDFSYNSSEQESLNIEVDMAVTGQAGSVIDVTKGLFKVSAEGMTQNPDTNSTPDFFVSSAGSKNLITFQGDLNYDGRVSMKDLAFLNAGAARQQLVDSTDNAGNTIQVASDDSYARDVDADFSGKIDLADLSVLDEDWGRSLHNGQEDFHGSGAELNWSTLDEQTNDEGDVVHTWDNTSFETQNLIEAESGYVGSLEAQDDSWLPDTAADTDAK